jgi:hypothetical protein
MPFAKGDIVRLEVWERGDGVLFPKWNYKREEGKGKKYTVTYGYAIDDERFHYWDGSAVDRWCDKDATFPRPGAPEVVKPVKRYRVHDINDQSTTIIELEDGAAYWAKGSGFEPVFGTFSAGGDEFWGQCGWQAGRWPPDVGRYWCITKNLVWQAEEETGVEKKWIWDAKEVEFRPAVGLFKCSGCTVTYDKGDLVATSRTKRHMGVYCCVCAEEKGLIKRDRRFLVGEIENFEAVIMPPPITSKYATPVVIEAAGIENYGKYTRAPEMVRFHEAALRVVQRAQRMITGVPICNACGEPVHIEAVKRQPYTEVAACFVCPECKHD